MINLRRLIKDINLGRHIITPISSPNLPIRIRERIVEQHTKRRTPSSFSYKSNLEAMTRTKSSPGKKFLNIAEAIRVKSSIPHIANSIRSKAHSIASARSNTLSDSKLDKTATVIGTMKGRLGNGASLSGTDLNENNTPLDTSMIQAIYSMLITWGLNPDLDALCTQMGLIQPGKHVVYGIRGYSFLKI
jgi:hypothetical protein